MAVFLELLFMPALPIAWPQATALAARAALNPRRRAAGVPLRVVFPRERFVPGGHGDFFTLRLIILMSHYLQAAFAGGFQIDHSKGTLAGRAPGGNQGPSSRA